MHPETGERRLFVGSFARRLFDLSVEQSDDLLSLLQAHVTSAENVLHWTLAPADLVLIDNRGTQSHLPTERGRAPAVHRLAVAGDAPLGVNGRHSYPLHRSDDRSGSWAAA